VGVWPEEGRRIPSNAPQKKSRLVCAHIKQSTATAELRSLPKASFSGQGANLSTRQQRKHLFATPQFLPNWRATRLAGSKLAPPPRMQTRNYPILVALTFVSSQGTKPNSDGDSTTA